MNIDFLIIIYALTCSWFIGFLVKRLFSFESDEICFPEDIAVCFGLGSAIIYFCVLLSSFLSNFSYIYIIYLFLLILSIVSFKVRKPIFRNPIKTGKWDISIITLICLLGLNVFYQITEGYWGHFGWDGFAIWGFKGKAIFLDKKVNSSLLTDIRHYGYAHMSYPLLLPANEAWIYSHLGYVNDQGVRLLSVAFYVGLLAVFYGGIRSFVSNHLALILIILFATLPVTLEQGTNGNSDLPLSFYFLTGSIYLFRWKNNKQLSNLIFAAIFYGICAQVKEEGIYMLYFALIIGLLFITVDIINRKERSTLSFCIYLGILFILYLPWNIVKWKYHLHGWSLDNLKSFFVTAFNEKVKIIVSVIQYYLSELFNYNIWRFLWVFIIFGFIVFLCRSVKRKYVYPLWLFFLLQGFLYFCVYSICLNGTSWYLQTSLTRTLLSIAPVGYYAAVLSLWNSNKKTQ